MTTSGVLFPAPERNRLQLDDGEVYYQAEVDLGVPAMTLCASLIESVPWRAEDIVVWGKTFPQPRLIAWYGDPGRTYNYSGIRLNPIPWTPELQRVRERVQSATDALYNSVLLNYYRNERDSMGFHSDDEAELGRCPTIASISLGEERTLIFQHKRDSTKRPVRLSLASGSLLLMKGETQKNWNHGIPKERGRRGPRVNLTFRLILGK